MEEAEFHKLSKDQLIVGLDNCYIISNQHFQAAKELASKELYGIANSHLILGAEEAFKSLLFFMRLENDSPDIKIDYLFKDHNQRHKVIKEHYAAFKSFTDIYLSTFIETGKKKFRHLLDSSDLEQSLEKRKKFFEEFGETRINEWWNNANQKKNQGFYIDFRDNNWIKPTQITEEDYLDSYNLVSELILTSDIIRTSIHDKDGS